MGLKSTWGERDGKGLGFLHCGISSRKWAEACARVSQGPAYCVGLKKRRREELSEKCGAPSTISAWVIGGGGDDISGGFRCGHSRNKYCVGIFSFNMRTVLRERYALLSTLRLRILRLWVWFAGRVTARKWQSFGCKQTPSNAKVCAFHTK